MDFIGGLIDLVDQGCDILFMGQAGFQDSFDAVKVVLRFGNGREGNAFTVVVQIGPHEHGVVPFFLSLDIIPVGKAVEAIIIEIVGKS